MGQITVNKTPIDGLYTILPTVHGDKRGYFTETYNERDMKEAGLDMVFVQDNQSSSTKGVLRGLHFQKKHPQGKLASGTAWSFPRTTTFSSTSHQDSHMASLCSPTSQSSAIR